MTMLYVITQEQCPNCPAAKAVVEEALAGTGIPVRIVDLKEMDSDFEFTLLEHQVFIAATPSIIIEDNGSLRLLSSGAVPTTEEVRNAVGVE